jgi:hypothetical protein
MLSGRSLGRRASGGCRHRQDLGGICRDLEPVRAQRGPAARSVPAQCTPNRHVPTDWPSDRGPACHPGEFRAWKTVAMCHGKAVPAGRAAGIW